MSEEGGVRLSGNLEKRLAQVRDEIRHLRESLRVLDEQVSYQESVADDAATRAVVAQTPLADRERHEALRDLDRLRRQRRETADRIAELTVEQDDLLDRLL
jgi:cell division septum initiation protein DivIVA